MKVPVKITVDTTTKKFEVSVGTPPVSALIKKELGIEKGTDNARTTKVGNLTMDQIKKISRMKVDSLLGSDTKARVKEIAGSCVPMGITIEGMDGRDFQKALDSGELTVD